MGGRRVWGAWVVFLVAAAPSLHTLSGVVRPSMPTSVRQRSVEFTAPALPAYRQAPLAYLSTAPPDSLRLLPGIGPVLAARIADARSGQRPFSSWDNLRRRVAGIGEKSVARLRYAAEPVDHPVAYWVRAAENKSK